MQPLAAASILAAMVPAAAAGLSLTALPAATAAADPLAGCTTTTGVIVAVDLTPWGQSIERGCAGTVTPETTGYQAMVAAGFTPTGDVQDGPAFVCRIDGYPTPAQDPCVNTPPSTAYWSYWYAPAGQDTWTYSQFGAMSFHPTAGSVNAWSFGAGTRPTFPPSAVWATTVGLPGGGTASTTPPVSEPAASPTTTTTVPRPQPTARNGTGSAPTAATRPPTAPPSAPPGGRSSATEPTSPKEGSTTTTAPRAAIAAGATTTTPPGTSPRIVEAAPVSAHDAPSAGSPLPLIVAAAVIAALLVGGGFIARRRRRTG
jgi:hypothetical protein